jgi:AbrB family looped-hinge helix DNA binding protein
MTFIRITSRGRATLPQHVRRELALEPGDEVEIVVRHGAAVILPARGASGRGRHIVDDLLGRGDVELSTDEIMTMTRGG